LEGSFALTDFIFGGGIEQDELFTMVLNLDSNIETWPWEVSMKA
jgi:hypothetical protein